MDFSTRKNGVRLLLLLAVVIGVAAVVQDLHFNNTLATGRSALRGTDGEVSTLQIKLAEFRAAQIGYLATGQDYNYWIGHATDLSQQIQSGFARLRAATASTDAQARIVAAETAFQQLTEIDGRARQAIADADMTVASLAIFTESPDAAQRIASELASVRSAEIDAAERAAAAALQWRLALNSGAMGLVLLFSLIAIRLSQQPAPSAAATMAQMLRELPPPVKSPSAIASAATPSTGTTAPASSPAVAVPTPPATPVVSRLPAAAAAPAPVPHVNLADAAELCADLARVMDERDVPDLLARAATVLEAKGLIIWMADADGTTLQPTLTHGYSDRVVSRLGTLDVEADNVTSLAFRSMRSQQVTGPGSSAAGAIAVPLVTATGCTGVLAAELRETKMVADATALARIIAAQFATIIAPSPAVEARAAEA